MFIYDVIFLISTMKLNKDYMMVFRIDYKQLYDFDRRLKDIGMDNKKGRSYILRRLMLMFINKEIDIKGKIDKKGKVDGFKVKKNLLKN